MQLRLDRKLDTLSITATLDLSLDERETLSRRNLSGVVVFQGATVADLELGKTFKFASLVELNTAEASLREAISGIISETQRAPTPNTSSRVQNDSIYDMNNWWHRVNKGTSEWPVSLILALLAMQLMTAYIVVIDSIDISKLKKLAGIP